MKAQKTNETRRQLAWILAITTGLVLGFFIKKVHIGLLIGLALGLLASGLLRRR